MSRRRCWRWVRSHRRFCGGWYRTHRREPNNHYPLSSSLRTQGPITTGPRGYAKLLFQPFTKIKIGGYGSRLALRLAGTTRSLLRRLTPAERIVALVFPVAAFVFVGDFHRDHVFRILEAELGRHADLHRIAVGPGQDFVAEFECHLGLRMQRGGHVERRVVAIGIRALEPAIFRACLGTDQFEEIAQRRAGPASDRAPALDADMARDLLDLRQLVELLQRPRFLVVDEAAHLELPVLAVDVGRVVELVIGVERKR